MVHAALCYACRSHSADCCLACAFAPLHAGIGLAYNASWGGSIVQCSWLPCYLPMGRVLHPPAFCAPAISARLYADCGLHALPSNTTRARRHGVMAECQAEVAQSAERNYAKVKVASSILVFRSRGAIAKWPCGSLQSYSHRFNSGSRFSVRCSSAGTVSAVARAMYCAWLGSASARRPTYSTQLSLEGGAMNCGNCECDDMPEDDTNDHNRRPGARDALKLWAAPVLPPPSNTRTQHGSALRATRSA